MRPIGRAHIRGIAMADYLASFHMPKFEDAEFQKRREEYVAKNGYTVTLPQFTDIIKFPVHKPMTAEERELYFSNRHNEIPKNRRRELQMMQEAHKEKINAILGSPTPRIARSAASIIQCIDDAQDFLISLAAIGRIAMKFLPRIAARFLGWPVMALWLMSTLLNYLTAPTYCMMNPMNCKRKLKEALRGKTSAQKAAIKRSIAQQEKFIENNLEILREKLKTATGAQKADLERAIAELEERLAYLRGGIGKALSEKARSELKAARRYTRSGGILPSFAEGIQMLQASKDIWGYGIAIGPMMGFVTDLASGGVRWLMGEKVSFRTQPTELELYKRADDRQHIYARAKRPKTKMTKFEFEIWKAEKIRKGEWGYGNKTDNLIADAMRMHTTYGGVLRKTDWKWETLMYASAEIAASGIPHLLEKFDPLEEVEGLEHIEIEAPVPSSPLVIEAFNDLGLNANHYVGWPSLGKRWATYEEISRTTAPIAAENLEHVILNCPNPVLREIANGCAQEAGLRLISNLIGEGSVELKDHNAITIVEALLDNDRVMARHTSPEQMKQFAQWCEDCEATGIRPGLKEILATAKNNWNLDFVPFSEVRKT